MMNQQPPQHQQHTFSNNSSMTASSQNGFMNQHPQLAGLGGIGGMGFMGMGMGLGGGMQQGFTAATQGAGGIGGFEQYLQSHQQPHQQLQPQASTSASTTSPFQTFPITATTSTSSSTSNTGLLNSLIPGLPQQLIPIQQQQQHPQAKGNNFEALQQGLTRLYQQQQQQQQQAQQGGGGFGLPTQGQGQGMEGFGYPGAGMMGRMGMGGMGMGMDGLGGLNGFGGMGMGLAMGGSGAGGSGQNYSDIQTQTTNGGMIPQTQMGISQPQPQAQSLQSPHLNLPSHPTPQLQPQALSQPHTLPPSPPKSTSSDPLATQILASLNPTEKSQASEILRAAKEKEKDQLGGLGPYGVSLGGLMRLGGFPGNGGEGRRLEGSGQGQQEGSGMFSFGPDWARDQAAMMQQQQEKWSVGGGVPAFFNSLIGGQPSGNVGGGGLGGGLGGILGNSNSLINGFSQGVSGTTQPTSGTTNNNVQNRSQTPNNRATPKISNAPTPNHPSRPGTSNGMRHLGLNGVGGSGSGSGGGVEIPPLNEKQIETLELLGIPSKEMEKEKVGGVGGGMGTLENVRGIGQVEVDGLGQIKLGEWGIGSGTGGKGKEREDLSGGFGMTGMRIGGPSQASAPPAPPTIDPPSIPPSQLFHISALLTDQTQLSARIDQLSSSVSTGLVPASGTAPERKIRPAEMPMFEGMVRQLRERKEGIDKHVEEWFERWGGRERVLPTLLWWQQQQTGGGGGDGNPGMGVNGSGNGNAGGGLMAIMNGMGNPMNNNQTSNSIGNPLNPNVPTMTHSNLSQPANLSSSPYSNILNPLRASLSNCSNSYLAEKILLSAPISQQIPLRMLQTSLKPDAFMKALFDHMRLKGTPITGTPYIDGKEVDLYQLFLAVMHEGGDAEVDKNKRWTIISDKLNFTNSSIQDQQTSNHVTEQALEKQQKLLQEATDELSRSRVYGGGSGVSGGGGPTPPPSGPSRRNQVLSQGFVQNGMFPVNGTSPSPLLTQATTPSNHATPMPMQLSTPVQQTQDHSGNHFNGHNLNSHASMALQGLQNPTPASMAENNNGIIQPQPLNPYVMNSGGNKMKEEQLEILRGKKLVDGMLAKLTSVRHDMIAQLKPVEGMKPEEQEIVRREIPMVVALMEEAKQVLPMYFAITQKEDTIRRMLLMYVMTLDQRDRLDRQIILGTVDLDKIRNEALKIIQVCKQRGSNQSTSNFSPQNNNRPPPTGSEVQMSRNSIQQPQLFSSPHFDTQPTPPPTNLFSGLSPIPPPTLPPTSQISLKRPSPQLTEEPSAKKARPNEEPQPPPSKRNKAGSETPVEMTPESPKAIASGSRPPARGRGIPKGIPSRGTSIPRGIARGGERTNSSSTIPTVSPNMGTRVPDEVQILPGPPSNPSPPKSVPQTAQNHLPSSSFSSNSPAPQPPISQPILPSGSGSTQPPLPRAASDLRPPIANPHNPSSNDDFRNFCTPPPPANPNSNGVSEIHPDELAKLLNMEIPDFANLGNLSNLGGNGPGQSSSFQTSFDFLNPGNQNGNQPDLLEMLFENAAFGPPPVDDSHVSDLGGSNSNPSTVRTIDTSPPSDGGGGADIAKEFSSLSGPATQIGNNVVPGKVEEPRQTETSRLSNATHLADILGGSSSLDGLGRSHPPPSLSSFPDSLPSSFATDFGWTLANLAPHN